jgi:choline-sulfatase
MGTDGTVRAAQKQRLGTVSSVPIAQKQRLGTVSSVPILAALACFALRAQPSTPVILISVDTLRADYLGRQTPHIDALAKSGTLFSQVSSPFPLTLPAHAALFTSTYPFASGVEDNGIPLSTPATTLATVLKNAGYRTGAFVSSFVLDRRFGLNRGFDVYDGPAEVHRIERKRPGAQVAEAATHWLEQNSSAPFFLFLHLYDLHLPYDPQRHSYIDELAYVDRVLGDFFAFLERRGLLQKALIVFTSDHGEGLGEHGESTHGYFIYQSTLHVPLILHGLKRLPQGRRDEAASLLDVAPTILDAVGLPRPVAMRGHSLLGPPDEREIYSESLYARKHFGTSALRSLRAGNYKYIEAPKPELYDLASDPNEKRNLYEQQRSKAAEMGKRIAAVRASSPARHASKPPTSETADALRSLGYLAGSTSSSRVEPHVDPKDRSADFERYCVALALASSGKLAESDTLLESLRDKLPEVADIRISLGLNQQGLGKYAEAAREFKSAVTDDPMSAQAHFELGFCYVHLHQASDAMQELKAALALEPWYTRADEALADLYIQNKDFPRARAHLNHLSSVDPHSYAANYNLGVLAAMQRNWSEARQRMLAAIQIEPGSAEAHNTLGNVYLQGGDLDKARQQFEDAIRLQSNLGPAHYNLGMIFQKQGKREDAEREFRAALAADR